MHAGIAVCDYEDDNTPVSHALRTDQLRVGHSHVLYAVCSMWTLWIFTVPSLRARDCSAAEKDALNLLFIGLPLLNITLPLIWKSFPFIYTTDVVVMGAIYAWKLWLPAAKAKEQK